MNNDLEQFSEERLKQLASGKYAGTGLGIQNREVAPLARITLSAKQAKPVAWIAWHQGCRAPDDCEDYLNAYTYKTEEKSVDGSDAFPVYTTPQPAHTKQDGWIKCSERMPETYLNVLLTDEADDMCIGQLESHDDTDFFVVGCPRYKATHWMPLPAAPKPESE